MMVSDRVCALWGVVRYVRWVRCIAASNVIMKLLLGFRAQVVRSSHMDGRKSVSKRTIIRFLWQEWNVHVRSVNAMRARE